MISFLKLIRYKNLLMVLLTMVLTKYALIDYFIQKGFLNETNFALLSLCILSIAASGYIINDIYDISADKINKPNKVYIENTISTKNAWTVYSVLVSIGLLCGFYISYITMEGNFLYGTIFLIVIFLLFLYSKYLKAIPLIGNLVVSLVCALTIYIVFITNFQERELSNYVFSNLNKPVGSIDLYIIVDYYIIFSFTTTFIREIVKDIEDLNGDYAMHMKTLPIILGKKRTRNISIFFSIVFALCLIMTIRDLMSDTNFLILALYLLVFTCIPLLYFIYKLWNAKTKKEYHFLSNLMKLIMFLGILSMGLFKFM